MLTFTLCFKQIQKLRIVTISKIQVRKIFISLFDKSIVKTQHLKNMKHNVQKMMNLLVLFNKIN